MTGFRNMDRSSFDKGLVDIHVDYVSGATGAIATINNIKGVKSITRTGVGAILVTLLDGYLGCAESYGQVVQATPSYATGWSVQATTDNQGAAPPTIAFQISGQNAGTQAMQAADTAIGDLVKLTLVLRRLK